MNSGLYAALSGNLAAMRRLDVISNNLANATTPGFKRDRLQFESLLAAVNNPTRVITPTGDAPILAGEQFFTDYSSGPAKQTGNSLDLALDGEGFFVVNTPEGRAYTRQGNFRLDSANRLVTADGHQVLGGGPLTLTGGRVDIDSEGKVFVDGGQVGTLDVVDFPKPYNLQKIGNALFIPADPAAGGPQPAPPGRVRQGFIEESNVSTIAEMTQLIEANRYFEACQKVVRSYDEMAGKAANELGRV